LYPKISDSRSNDGAGGSICSKLPDAPPAAGLEAAEADPIKESDSALHGGLGISFPRYVSKALELLEGLWVSRGS